MADIPMRYSTAYTWTGEAMGGNIEVPGHPPLPAGSPHDADRYSPEHLLVATVEACLANYILLFARMSRLEISAYHSTAEGELEHSAQGGYRFNRIVVRPEVHVPAASRTLAERIIEKAHKSCLIARSLNCSVAIEPTISD